MADNIWLDTPAPGMITFEDVAYKPRCAINMIEESQPLAVAAAVSRAGGPRVNIRGRKGLVDLVRREFAGDFDYELVTDDGVAQQGWQTIEVAGTRVEATGAISVADNDDEAKAGAADGITMGNPLSSYKR